MRKKQSLHIIHFGLIGHDKKGDKYRHIIFRDDTNEKEIDFMVYEKKRPSLWEDILKLEKGKKIPPYPGYIARFNGIDLVVLGDETLEDAFRQQKWKLDIQKSISYKEAEKMRKESRGYCTNDTQPGAVEISWREINKDTRMIKFRYYAGEGTFSWSKWFEILRK